VKNMISDFIYLELQEYGDNYKSFFLELPDIFNEDEDNMIPCGEVIIKVEEDGFWGVHINLSDSFISLSENEIYERKSLIEAVLIHLKMQTGISFELSEVYLKDCSGEYKYCLYK